MKYLVINEGNSAVSVAVPKGKSHKTITISIGQQAISEDDYNTIQAEMKKQPLTRSRFKRVRFKAVDDSVPTISTPIGEIVDVPNTPDIDEDIMSKNAVDVKSIIEETYDRPALETMLKDEKSNKARKGIILAIEKQLDRISVVNKNDNDQEINR